MIDISILKQSSIVSDFQQKCYHNEHDLTCCNEEAGEGSLSSAFHSRSIWWTCSSSTTASTVRLSFLANCRSRNISCKSSTRFFALSLKSLCDADLQLFLGTFFIVKPEVLSTKPYTHKYHKQSFSPPQNRERNPKKNEHNLQATLSWSESIFQHHTLKTIYSNTKNPTTPREN